MTIANRTMREGIVAGLVAAGAVAIWFLLLDLVAGQPLGTPRRLGESVASFFGGTGGGAPLLYVLGFTVFHVLAFALAGRVVSAVVNQGEEEPSILWGLFILFVAFELAWYGLSAILSQGEAYGPLAWYQVMIANLIAAASMGFYLYRRHPLLASRAAHAVAGGVS